MGFEPTTTDTPASTDHLQGCTGDDDLTSLTRLRADGDQDSGTLMRKLQKLPDRCPGLLIPASRDAALGQSFALLLRPAHNFKPFLHCREGTSSRPHSTAAASCGCLQPTL